MFDKVIWFIMLIISIVAIISGLVAIFTAPPVGWAILGFGVIWASRSLRGLNRGNSSDEKNQGKLHNNHYNEDEIHKIKKKAKNGDKTAQRKLGDIYYEKCKFQKALKWFRKVAKIKDAYSQYKIGRIYEKGIKVTKDLGVAKHWYKKVVNNGRGEIKRKAQNKIREIESKLI